MNDSLEQLPGLLFLIVGPSGSGKGSVIRKIKENYSGFVYPVSYTTRAPRENETDGEVYHFISKQEFKEMIANDELLEYAVVHSDNFYGSSKKDILEPLKSGGVVIREVDIQGFHSIQKLLPAKNLVSIFMRVGDLEDLKRRILNRGAVSDEEMEKRMISAKNELEKADTCDYQVENHWDQFAQCVKEVTGIVLDEIQKRMEL